MKSDRHQTWHGDRGPRARCFTSKTFGGLTHSFAARGTENLGVTRPLRAKFHPHRCNVSPLRGENPQNRPLSKLNNRHFALRAMLPVKKGIPKKPQHVFFHVFAQTTHVVASATWICMCGHTRDPIIYSKFHRNPFRGFGTPGDQNLAFPITLASRFYNSLYYRTSRDVHCAIFIRC